MEKVLVSIIMPVYNAEMTLSATFDSIINQTYRDIEIIVVNDCSSDQSLEKLFEITSRLDHRGYKLKIINHEKNRGVAAARNTALENVSGEYLYYLDADDRLEPNAIELLVSEAVANNADIVGCNWFLSFQDNERIMNQKTFNTPFDAIEKMMYGVIRWNLWLFMVKRSLYDDTQIRFIEGANMGEDMMVMLKLFSKAKVVSYIDKPLYHYSRTNTGSITAQMSQKHISEVSQNVAEVEKYFKMKGTDKSIEKKILHLKLNIKLPLLFTGQKKDFLLWQNLFTESNMVVMENKYLPLRTRMMQWCAAKGVYFPIKLYNTIFLKFVYGVLYK